jgi:hypothetical protein
MNMKNWLGVIVRVILICTLLYPGHLLAKETQNSEPPNIDVSLGWILFLFCICILVLAFILLWRGRRTHKGNRMDDYWRNGQ